jgi:hypothetical protein
MGEAGHVDLGNNFVNKAFYLLTSIALESMVLIFVINAMVWVGRGYAITSLVINLLYYNHFAPVEETRMFVAAFVISIAHSGAIFFLSELFKNKTKKEQKVYTCQICAAEFNSSKLLEDHLVRVHRKKRNNEPNNKNRPNNPVRDSINGMGKSGAVKHSGNGQKVK